MKKEWAKHIFHLIYEKGKMRRRTYRFRTMFRSEVGSRTEGLKLQLWSHTAWV